MKSFPPGPIGASRYIFVNQVDGLSNPSEWTYDGISNGFKRYSYSKSLMTQPTGNFNLSGGKIISHVRVTYRNITREIDNSTSDFAFSAHNFSATEDAFYLTFFTADKPSTQTFNVNVTISGNAGSGAILITNGSSSYETTSSRNVVGIVGNAIIVSPYCFGNKTISGTVQINSGPANPLSFASRSGGGSIASTSCSGGPGDVFNIIVTYGNTPPASTHTITSYSDNTSAISISPVYTNKSLAQNENISFYISTKTSSFWNVWVDGIDKGCITSYQFNHYAGCPIQSHKIRVVPGTPAPTTSKKLTIISQGSQAPTTNPTSVILVDKTTNSWQYRQLNDGIKSNIPLTGNKCPQIRIYTGAKSQIKAVLINNVDKTSTLRDRNKWSLFELWDKLDPNRNDHTISVVFEPRTRFNLTFNLNYKS